MKKISLFILAHLFFMQLDAQTLLKMEQLNGKYVMPCKVNDLTVKFIIDSGEEGLIISITDALFMLKNGYITADDINGTEYERFAKGHIGDGTTINIRKLEIGNTKFSHLAATVNPDLRAPMVIGQTVLGRMGKIEFDYSNQLVTWQGNRNDLLVNSPTASFSNNMHSGTKNVAATNDQKLLVKVNTTLYSSPENGQFLLQVHSNTFVNLIDETAKDQNYLYVDYQGRKGYINRLALEMK